MYPPNPPHQDRMLGIEPGRAGLVLCAELACLKLLML